MDINHLDQSTKDDLKQRNLFLRQRGTPTVVEIRVADGSPSGFLIGWVEQVEDPLIPGTLAWRDHARRATLQAGYWRGRVDAPYDGSEGIEAESIEQAISEILDRASYGDVPAAHERASGRVETYTATIGEEQAEWLADCEEPKGMTHRGGGRIELTNIAVAYLRGSPRNTPYVDANNQFYLDRWENPYQLTRKRV
ncbi:hypothetical protein GCM10010174_48280 [Kutzneria viridogrisea]|uniref:Uncharacterized protein n=2 Tax=Kutzneria TaxID=43356 RepID=W5WDK4_9PSEU|nr:hypothetical protein [Kutzneria albida]AHH98952.1 hypothetical protein KALB_5590 [Kutzneria albida DSM 43870]MBA8923494.1 hypothetical protein [Kutzneria viridogrisea]